MFEDISYKRPLVIGTGGGNDIVSATLILCDLINAGKKPDLAGVCSPGALHFYKGQPEKSVNLVTENTKRYRQSLSPLELSFIDSKVPSLLKQNGIHAQVYNLSCRFGTKNLINSLNELIEKQNYDGVVAVDVGGDILARGAKDPTILSPLMDFTILYVLGQLNISSLLIEFGLQTDGELRPQSCKEIISELEENQIIKNIEDINPEDKSVELFKKIYKEISKIRHGHTAVMTLQTFSAKEDIATDYRMRIQVLDKKIHHSFLILLEKKYFKKAFLIDPKELAQKRTLVVPYNNLFEHYIKSKKIVDTKTEMDLLHYKLDDVCIWLGLMCPQIQGKQREELLDYGIKNLENHADVALLWKKDEAVVDKKFRKNIVGDFIVAGKIFDKIYSTSVKLEMILNSIV